jgi:putative transposase
MITRRCTQRQLLLRPDDETTNAFTYCLGLSAQRYSVDVLFTLAEGNHHHTIFLDPNANCSAFAEYFHKLVARSQNALRGRSENMWSAEECCITRLLDADTVIQKIVYAATNPVKDQLVERVHHWPGASAYRAFMSGGVMRARRPRHFFRRNGKLPETVELRIAIPPQLGDPATVRERVREGVRSVEQSCKQERIKTGRTLMGRRGVLRQSWKTFATSDQPRRTLRPRFAGRRDSRIRALESYKAFLHSYRRARASLLAGADAVFPEGTYQIARLMKVRVDSSPQPEALSVWWPPPPPATVGDIAHA